jgi:acetyl-CoA carboxylase biotin carboxyl carrier protein
VQRGDSRVRIRRGFYGPVPQEIVLAPQTYQPVAAVPGGAPAASPVAAPPLDGPTKPKETEPPADPGLVLVKSPIVGTFYESPSPGAPPFVRIGERVLPGKVLCIIESMKLMNEIEAETAGVVESRLVMNGQPVEYGEALFGIRAV